MDLGLQLPPLPTLTLMSSVKNVTPDNPPDPPSSSLFPESFPSEPLANPTKGQPAKGPEEALYVLLPGDTSAKSMETAVMMVIAIIECGYHPNKEETPLNAAFNKARAESFDPEPLTPDCPTYFHRLAVMAGTISHHIKPPGSTASEQGQGDSFTLGIAMGRS